MAGKSTRRLNLVGQRFGRLKVDAEGERRRRPGGQTNRYWRCVCACGNRTEHTTGQLRSGAARSCGCARTEATIRRNTRHGYAKYGSRPAEYEIWRAMRRRCSNPKNDDYQYYGARGISVCSRWDDFAQFYADMGTRTTSKHSIDRIDNDGNYEPSNCRWATAIQQRRNRRDYLRAH